MVVSPKLYLDDSDVPGYLRDLSGADSAITADTGSTQADAYPLVSAFNRVTTVATTGDSVRLPAAVGGQMLVVKNGGANSMDVFPADGDTINALSADAAFAMAAAAVAIFVSTSAGTWDTIS